MPKVKRLSEAQLNLAVAELACLNTKNLQHRWRALFKSEPPAKMREGFLRLAIAYKLQATTHGGLGNKTVKQLSGYAGVLQANSERSNDSERTSGHDSIFGDAPKLAPGTRLMREWNGNTEVVDVTEEGLVWRGTKFRTLSAVAVAISGTKWSGPRFFGLEPSRLAKRTREKEASVALLELVE